MMNRAATTAPATGSVMTESIQNPGRVSAAVWSHAGSLAVILKERIDNAISALSRTGQLPGRSPATATSCTFPHGRVSQATARAAGVGKDPRGYLLALPLCP